jgi:cytochrome oxidase Cu insertion factor (SCO1/SenC/PrrC family)
MKPILISAAVVLIAAVVFVGLLASRVMGQDVVKDPAAPAAPGAAAAPATQPGAAGKGPLDFVMKDIDGNDYDLARLKGKVVWLQFNY